MSLLDKVGATRPTYTTTLPVSKKEIRYQPFVVKERRNLLLALEENKQDAIVEALGEIINKCTFGEVSITDKKFSTADAEYIFVMIRNKSVGETLEVYHNCEECGNKNLIELNLENVKVSGGESDLNIQLSDNLWMQMRYPTITELTDLPENPSEEEVIRIISTCIQSIVKGDELINITDFTFEEVVEFIENLTQEQLDKVEEFFDDIPRLHFDQPYKCKCGHDNVVVIEGIENFFV